MGDGGNDKTRLLANPPARWFTRYPVTTVLVLQYVVLAVWPGWRTHNPHLGFIAWIVFLGALAAFTTETLLSPLSKRGGRVNTTSVVTPRAAKLVLLSGLAASFGSATLGASTYASQVGAVEVSPLAPILTPFASWTFVGAAFLLYCFARGDITRRQVLKWLALTELAYLGYALVLGITAPFAAFSLALFVTSALVGLVRPRTLVIGAVVAFLIWPTIYNIRNGYRSQITTSGYNGQQFTSSARLREDLLLGRDATLPPSLHVGQPSVLTVARYGLIPSAVDPFPRPDLAGGKALSAYVGSSASSSLTLTVLGNMRALGGGTLAMMGIVATLTAAACWLRLTITPLRLTVVLSMFRLVFWIEAGWPDPIGGVLQTLVAAVVALVILKALRSLDRELAVAAGAHRARA